MFNIADVDSNYFAVRELNVNTIGSLAHFTNCYNRAVAVAIVGLAAISSDFAGLDVAGSSVTSITGINHHVFSRRRNISRIADSQSDLAVGAGGNLRIEVSAKLQIINVSCYSYVRNSASLRSERISSSIITGKSRVNRITCTAAIGVPDNCIFGFCVSRRAAGNLKRIRAIHGVNVKPLIGICNRIRAAAVCGFIIVETDCSIFAVEISHQAAGSANVSIRAELERFVKFNIADGNIGAAGFDNQNDTVAIGSRIYRESIAACRDCRCTSELKQFAPVNLNNTVDQLDIAGAGVCQRQIAVRGGNFKYL